MKLSYNCFLFVELLLVTFGLRVLEDDSWSCNTFEKNFVNRGFEIFEGLYFCDFVLLIYSAMQRQFVLVGGC